MKHKRGFFLSPSQTASIEAEHAKRDPKAPSPRDRGFAKIADALRTNTATELTVVERIAVKRTSLALATAYESGDAAATRKAADACPVFLHFEGIHNKAQAAKPAATGTPAAKPATAPSGKAAASPQSVAFAEFRTWDHIKQNRYIREGGKIK